MLPCCLTITITITVSARQVSGGSICPLVIAKSWKSQVYAIMPLLCCVIDALLTFVHQIAGQKPCRLPLCRLSCINNPSAAASGGKPTLEGAADAAAGS